jgi:cell division protein FtsL
LPLAPSLAEKYQHKNKDINMTYSNTMALGRQNSIGRNQNAVTFRRARPSLGPISNTIILVVLACLLGLLYLTQVTKTNAYGYKINSLQQQQSALQSQYSNLQVASARLQSVTRVAVAPTASVSN